MSFTEQFCTKVPDDSKTDEETKMKEKEEERMRERRKGEVEAAALRRGLRLNRTLIPYHYDLELWPRFYERDDFSFTGNVSIHFTCKEETDVIVLHTHKLTVYQNNMVLK